MVKQKRLEDSIAFQGISLEEWLMLNYPKVYTEYTKHQESIIQE